MAYDLITLLQDDLREAETTFDRTVVLDIWRRAVSSTLVERGFKIFESRPISLTFAEVKEVVGVSVAAIRKVLAEAEICRPKKNEPNETDAAMFALRAEGMSLAQIGRRFGVTRQCVDQRLKRYAK